MPAYGSPRPSTYSFLLKEGTEFHSNYMDYSLLLLHTRCLEQLKSPITEANGVENIYFARLANQVINLPSPASESDDEQLAF